MASTAKMAKEPQYLSVTIEGLRKGADNEASEPKQCEIELKNDAPISEIWTKIEGVYTPSYVAMKNIFSI